MLLLLSSCSPPVDQAKPPAGNAETSIVAVRSQATPGETETDRLPMTTLQQAATASASVTLENRLTTASATATLENRLPPERWQEWPVIPTVSRTAINIYQKGLEMGNDPHDFSKVGDCQNIPSYFLGIFDDPQKYRLDKDDQYLLSTIKNFSGSFSHKSLAVSGGYNVASVLSPLMADNKQCQKNETPLACEIRQHNPSLVIISMETWWSKRPASIYERYLRQIVDTVIEHGAVPILATKADNWEGNHQINAAIAKVAYDYDIPLWNFWLAVQPLPNLGLSNDGFHLTYGLNEFDNPLAMRSAWPVRNLTALQALDAV
jgi:hypothetical protein